MNGIIISFLRRTKSDVSLSELELFECNNTSDSKYNQPSLAMYIVCMIYKICSLMTNSIIYNPQLHKELFKDKIKWANLIIHSVGLENGY